MRISSYTSPILPLLSLLVGTALALPSGAGNCPGGRAAVGVEHLAGDVTEGTLAQGGITLTIGGQVLSAGQVTELPLGQDLTWTLNATQKPLRGFLMRAEDRSDDAVVDTTDSLVGVDKHVQVAETVCVNAFRVGGVTHTDNKQKRLVKGLFRLDSPVQELQMDVTIVIKNRNANSVFYYSAFVVSTVDTGKADDNADGNADREDEAGNNGGDKQDQDLEEDDDALVEVEEEEKEDESDLPEEGNNTFDLILRASSCTPELPCDQCEGDCNKNSHCSDGMECFYRPDDTPIPGCVGTGVAGKDYCYFPQIDTLRLRSADCSDDRPCDTCQGSCMLDSDCDEGLSCFLRPDATPVPGCDGSGIAGRNYCYETPEGVDVDDILTLRASDCNRTNPCAMCEGDCQKDRHCEGDLECFLRPDKTPVPGCSDSFLGVSGRNYCFQPQENTLTLRDTLCASFLPCQECEGECSDDEDCYGQLKCKKRSGSMDAVAGCGGTGVSGRDYCYDATKAEDLTISDNFVAPNTTLTVSPTDRPTRAPSTASPTGAPQTPAAVPVLPLPTESRPTMDFVESGTILPMTATPSPTPKPTRRPRPTFPPVPLLPTPMPTPRARPTPMPTSRPGQTPRPTLFPEWFTDPPDDATPTPQATLNDAVEESNNNVAMDGGGNTALRTRPIPCSAQDRCGECQGDCNNDAQCQGVLQCFQRPANSPVPGCSGEGTTGYDYCAFNLNTGNASQPTWPAPGNTPPTPNPTRANSNGNAVSAPQPTLPVPGNTPPTPNPTRANSNGNAVPQPTLRVPSDNTPSTPNPTPNGNSNGIGNSLPSLQDRNQECSEIRKCGECMGDCDDDSQCTGALRCFFRSNLEAVPGCAGQGSVGKDYCAFDKRDTNVNNNNENIGNDNTNDNNIAANDVGSDYNNDNNIATNDGKMLITRNPVCTGNNPCGECQGDCDGDNECVGNLQCFFRVGLEEVPGCSGPGVGGRDYCARNPAYKNRVRRRAI